MPWGVFTGISSTGRMDFANKVESSPQQLDGKCVNAAKRDVGWY